MLPIFSFPELAGGGPAWGRDVTVKEQLISGIWSGICCTAPVGHSNSALPPTNCPQALMVGHSPHNQPRLPFSLLFPRSSGLCESSLGVADALWSQGISTLMCLCSASKDHPRMRATAPSLPSLGALKKCVDVALRDRDVANQSNSRPLW